MKLSQLFIITAVTATGLLGISALVLLKLKSKLFWTRWFTWLGITIAFTSTYLLGQTSFNVLICILSFVMMFELVRLLKLEIFSSTLVLLLSWYDLYQIATGRSAAVFFWLIPVAVFVLALVESAKSIRIKSAVGGMYWSLFISLGFVQLVQYPDKSLALLLAVACFDVASFIGGKTLGKAGTWGFHFSPKTSPNKTVAGLITGAVALYLVLVVLGKFSIHGFAIVLVGAVLGDYLESWIKRLAGVKDAANWLPGFGGLLDRFDSLVLLAPFALFIF